VTLTTSKGTIVIGLFDDMPITTGNFKNLTQFGVYDGTLFHRVVHNFVIQGGDASGKGIVVPTIHDELPNKHSNVRSSVAMAKTSLPNSATSQFYINLVDNSGAPAYLDSNYSVFGQVVQGMDVVDSIGSVQTDTNDRPLQNVTVQTARLQAVPEYAAWVFLVVFMAAALFAVMIHKKTRGRDPSTFA
jgi:peptidylprolyl isomerase